jgi:hypothetical protein
MTAGEIARPGWNEHLTATVFDAIARRHRGLYERATAGGERNRINRLIGSRVKAVAGADVKVVDGKPVVGQLPRSSGALIRRYSLLAPGQDRSSCED